MPCHKGWRVMAVAVGILAAMLGHGFAGGERPMLRAVEQGDLARVNAMLAAGEELEQRDPARRTPLLIATRLDHVDIALALIAAGADVNARDNIRDTPFLYAGAEGRNKILRAILASGRADMASTNRYGGTALIPAAHHGHPETVRILLATDIDIDHVNRLGWTALMEAVILGDGGEVYQEIVGDLVRAGARDIPDNDGVSALEHARRRGYTEIAELIASAG